MKEMYTPTLFWPRHYIVWVVHATPDRFIHVHPLYRRVGGPQER